jgi:hypothetical protein
MALRGRHPLDWREDPQKPSTIPEVSHEFPTCFVIVVG